MSHRVISVDNRTITIRDSVDTIYEKVVTPFGNSGKVSIPKKEIGKRVYVIVLKD